MIELAENIYRFISSLVWGLPMLVLMFGTGIYFTFRTRFFQLTRAKDIADTTVFAIFREKSVRKSKDKNSMSQFQAMATALAGTIGTGNIAGVATAITIGGAGAIFWMWVSAFFGMMTGYSENVLGIHYRPKLKNGEKHAAPIGGPMYYIEYGLKEKKLFAPLAKPLASLFALFCLCASFGIGNMTQANTIASTLQSSFAIHPLSSGIAVAALCAAVIIGGVKRIASLTEKLVPFMAVMQFLLTVIVCVSNYKSILSAFSSIFTGAFGLSAIGGGIGGSLVKSMTVGFKRGVFSNEAGLGSSVLAHTSSDDDNPVRQGMWNIFEIFFDTIVSCTLTALAVLSSGVAGTLDAGGKIIDGAPLVTLAFGKTFGDNAGAIISLMVLFFAFSTMISWSLYGVKVTEYLFSKKAVIVYKILFIIFIVAGSAMDLHLVWGISDTLNGLMALPNLFAVLLLSGTVIKYTNDYKIKHKK